ncbi:hypothetical protein TrVE_jg7010 [Triparma verrucosa]|uniref:Uncharacterized protein n=2 Tax=Triparma TaxID=722752 RepID=A0A9W7BQ06_9STRA|nr:hypothetical protein TrST_g4273 [Triparma strigata]GMI04122.1 hypothetical protein TrVE_jg7010 [Triparma verrucosa]|mmetsp:Transcript_28935/g.54613  ORF Transcript_28935/g.54613 Transcript_28935/m.54613 type:complete len:206 (-) Transcript_28935:51-668(-)|eukprot:CAMPEP_0182519418 /NCGR_PEP_ID=MMETSP1321-20130603/45089_1 /TAXON_ID=91990 /ORGANISM="Bolidomonas sp., Strain RCC1657" /LENGTH=205 /DNA_ID=CAMNT_0024727395 /DNA_START=428 /DNA_END=1045 /DNA_ORIENTATION=+
MGAKLSLEDELVNLRITSKQMSRSATKCEKNEKAALSKLKKAIEQGNMEGAKIYGQNAIREKNQALNCLRMSSRIDAVASRLETAIRTKAVTKSMTGVVAGMQSAMKSMDVEKISKTMDEFEKQFEDMDVRSGYMENAMSNSTASATPADEVDTLIQMVAEQNGLELNAEFDAQGQVGQGVPKQKQKEEVKEDDDLEKRLAALRK